INNDPPVGEPLENYTVQAALVGGNTASAQGGITDSDVASVAITGSTVEEGALAKFTLTLNQASAVAETVNLTAITGTADASDFVNTQFFDAAGNPISSTVVFAAGETSKDVYVQTINNDPPVGEPLENYTVQAALVGGNTASAQGGITDSDVPAISINSVSAVEGQPLVFTISLSQPAAGPVTVNWATALDASGVDPAELTDFVSASNSVTFAPGESSKTVSIATVVDTINEANETMQVVLSSAIGGVIANGVGIGTILDDDNPTAATVTATVDEDGLPAGLGDAAAGDAVDANADADNDETTFSGTLIADFGEDAPGSFDLSGMDGQSAVLGAETVTYAWNAGSNTLTASTTSGDRVGTDLFSVSLNPATGAYAVNLLANALHPVVGTEDDLTAALSYTATDASGATATGTLNVVIDDDLPTVSGADEAIEELNFNLVVVLDLSGSMRQLTDISDGQGGFLTRFEASVEAINRLMDAYDSLGNVAVRLVTFASGASSVGDVWTDIDTARTQLGTLTPNGLTNYLAALEAVSGIPSMGPGSYGDGIWNDAGRFTMDGVQNVSYFASDGNPTAGGVINATRQGLWEDFLNDNDILSYAIGLGSSINVNNLNPIAYDGRESGTDINALSVTEFAQLTDTINATVPPIMGNLIGQAGADGAAAFAVTIDGTTFTYDVAADSLAVSGAQAYTFDEAENLLTVTSAKNGTWQVDMDSGSFTYQADIAATGTDSLAFAITDGDGDVASDNLVIELLPEPGGQPGAPGPESDLLVGTSGNDVFAWELADIGTQGNPQEDAVLYFGTEGDDVLDLSDLLVDATPGSGGDIGDLDRFINISSDGTDSFVQISSSGGFTDGNFDPSAVDQSITLVGVDLGNDSTQAIRDLLSSGQLQTD
ncbi:MAG: type I secretion C-terminal target domain-containing protein, partial [Gammaproteobacteria bacterium]|nr:type I secretion C-terminal target domain-containing protein [Gammaproteobacteria bacterium]